MVEIVRFEVGSGSVLVETDEDSFGIQRVSRGPDGVIEAGRQLKDALASIENAANVTLDVLRKMSPDSIEVEFGIKLAGEAGALIAKASTEGHFTVRLSWSPDSGKNERPAPAAVSRPATS
jgi:hypothetical protein